jgi:hypothetical protein
MSDPIVVLTGTTALGGQRVPRGRTRASLCRNPVATLQNVFHGAVLENIESGEKVVVDNVDLLGKKILVISGSGSEHDPIHQREFRYWQHAYKRPIMVRRG